MTIQRVSTYYTHLQAMGNIKTARDRFAQLEEQQVTGKAINSPKDDPVAIRQILDLETRLETTAQYQKNINNMLGIADVSSSTLDTVGEILLEIREIAQTQSSVVSTSAERSAVAATIESYLEEIVSLGNAKYLGKFVFGGTNTLSGTGANSSPFNITRDSNGYISAVTPNPNGIDDLSQREVREGYYMAANIAGTMPFMPDGQGSSSDIFQVLMDMRDHLLNNQTDQLDVDIASIQSSIDQVTEQEVELGIRRNRLEAIDLQHDEQTILHKNIKSGLEDVDYAELMIEYNTAQAVLNTTLQTSASLLQLSLANFI